MTVRRTAAPAVALALALAGCATSSLSADQLRAGARPACAAARARLSRIATPAQPSAGTPFLGRGIAALGPELTALDRLHPSGALGADYHTAVTATGQELAALKSTLNGLKAGNDPVVAIKTLQQQLAPLELRAAAAWARLGIPSCAVT